MLIFGGSHVALVIGLSLLLLKDPGYSVCDLGIRDLFIVFMYSVIIYCTYVLINEVNDFCTL